MSGPDYRRGLGRVVRALFASLASVLNALSSGGATPISRPDDDLPDKRPEYRP